MDEPPAPDSKRALSRSLERDHGRDLASDPAAVATYVAQLAEELAQLSRRGGLTTLAYILDMARLEARGVAASARPGHVPDCDDIASRSP